MKVVIKKTIRPDASTKCFVHMIYEGTMDTIPHPGMKIVTGNVDTMLGKVSFKPETGWVGEEWDSPDLSQALAEVERGQSFEKLVREHLAAGWKIVET